jgi:hypothetical protein
MEKRGRGKPGRNRDGEEEGKKELNRAAAVERR